MQWSNTELEKCFNILNASEKNPVQLQPAGLRSINYLYDFCIKWFQARNRVSSHGNVND